VAHHERKDSLFQGKISYLLTESREREREREIVLELKVNQFICLSLLLNIFITLVKPVKLKN